MTYAEQTTAAMLIPEVSQLLRTIIGNHRHTTPQFPLRTAQSDVSGPNAVADGRTGCKMQGSTLGGMKETKFQDEVENIFTASFTGGIM